MSRYLTPSKIGLLALIQLYVDSMVPTTATIPILSFMVSHLLRKQSGRDTPSIGRSPIITIDEFQSALISHASAIPGRTLWDLFLKNLWTIDSFDALHVFFDGLNILLTKSREELQQEADEGAAPQPTSAEQILLARSSPLGIFVRRAQLEFTRLPLHDGIQLWKYFVVYREPTLATWRKRNPGAGKTSFDANLRVGFGGGKIGELLYGDLGRGVGSGNGGLGPAVASADDAERLMEFQIDQMQSKETTWHCLGCTEVQ